MSRIQIPIDILTSRLNLSERFSGVRSQSLSTRLANLKPISEFLDFKRLSKPANFSEVQSRVNYNLGYFSSNYAAVFLMLSIYSLLTNLVLLFVILLVVGGVWGIGRLEGQDLDIGVVRATSSQLYTWLLVVVIPLGLYASPITTILWLIGASGVSIIGHASFMDKPIDEAFSGEAGSRRKQWEQDEGGWQRPRVQEVDSDDDKDRHGTRLALSDKRFASDPLRFTGVDMSLTTSTKPRRGYSYNDAERSSEDDSEDSEYLEEDDQHLTVRDKEEVLVQAALARIRRAQEKGKEEVKLNQEEIDALERRRKRMQEAAASKAKKGSSSSSRKSGEKKRQSDRKAVNIASLVEPQPDPKKKRSKRRSDESSSRDTRGGPGIITAGPDGPTYTSIGYYPETSRQSSRSRSTTKQPRDTASGTSRHFSDGMRPNSSSNSPHRPLPEDDGWSTPNRRISVRSPYHVADPFDYQVTTDQPLPITSQYMQPSGGQRNYSGPADVSYASVRRSVPQEYPAAHRPPSDPSLRYRTSSRAGVEVIEIPDSSSEESDSSDELGRDVQVFHDDREPEPFRSVPRKHVGGRKKGKGK
ncbi:hypothetical protein ACMFMF_006415 [Clarireedia jacksonii]